MSERENSEISKYAGEEMETTRQPTLGEFVRGRREELGMSRGQFCRSIWQNHGVYVDTNYIALVEHGRIKIPKPDKLQFLAAGTGTTEAYLLKLIGYDIPDEYLAGSPNDESSLPLAETFTIAPQ